MNIAIGADHRGFAYKEFIKKQFPAIEWHDVGADSAERSDYPAFSTLVCDLILQGKVQAGVLICGSGVGMAIAANRYKNIYAGVVWNEQVACVGKEDDNVNVLVIPSDFVTQEMAVACIKAWMGASFKHGRYQERIDMIDQIK